MNAKKISILLDDFLSSQSTPLSRVYINPQKRLVANSYEEISGVINDIEECLKNGLYVVTLFSYEMGNFFNGLPLSNTKSPLIIAWSFKNVQKLSKASVEKWLTKEIKKEVVNNKLAEDAGICNVRMNSNEEKYKTKINRIHHNIKAGNTYQVNYTFKILAEQYGPVVGLYSRLRERQPSRFGALIRDENVNVLSFSPEWFVEVKGNCLKAKPMKGTLAADGRNASDLIEDKKNRAENLMIVDLLRNDLGRVSEVGSVKVPRLFEVERVGEIFQMTSTVESKIKKNIGLKKLLQAIYPCGSVTGAPKHKTMQIINDLEDGDRGFYCGSIGWLDPCVSNNKQFGDLMLSVSIRTAVIHKHNFSFGVGSGITIDSDYKEEWKECLLKASFLIKLPSGVGLFETIRVENNVPKFFHKHITRLARSADFFGIPCDSDYLEEIVKKEISNAQINKEDVYRLKINLNPKGNFSIELHPLVEIESIPKIFWAAELIGKTLSIIDSSDPTFYHKTTNRNIYDFAWKQAEKKGGFDGIFLNEKGEVTEGGRSNLLIKNGDKWKTPPVTSGLLPGVMRSTLLENKEMSICETVLTPNDIINAESVYICNSLRGLIKVDSTNLNTSIGMLEYSTIEEE